MNDRPSAGSGRLGKENRDDESRNDGPKPVPFRARMSIYLIAVVFFGLMFCMCAFIFAIAATM
jgi:hypothetical protein